MSANNRARNGACRAMPTLTALWNVTRCLQGPQALVYDFEMSGACLEEHGTLQKLKESPHKAHVATSHGYGKLFRYQVIGLPLDALLRATMNVCYERQMRRWMMTYCPMLC